MVQDYNRTTVGRTCPEVTRLRRLANNPIARPITWMCALCHCGSHDLRQYSCIDNEVKTMPAKSFCTAPEILRRIQKDIKWSSLTAQSALGRLEEDIKWLARPGAAKLQAEFDKSLRELQRTLRQLTKKARKRRK